MLKVCIFYLTPAVLASYCIQLHVCNGHHALKSICKSIQSEWSFCVCV